VIRATAVAARYVQSLRVILTTTVFTLRLHFEIYPDYVQVNIYKEVMYIYKALIRQRGMITYG